MTIKQWPKLERPREKLLKFGPHSLSDAELLAIFLRTGCAGKSALDLSRELLSKFGGLRAVLNCSLHEFCEGIGLGTAKYAQLHASMEIAKRHLKEQLVQKPVFSHCAMVKRFLLSELRDLKKEAFYLLYLDSQNALLHHETLFIGTIDSATVYPREIIVQALKHNAAAIIIAHNHPSGAINPSQSDILLTKRLVKALKLIDIRVLDHLIIGDGQVFSFAQEQIMPTG